LACRTVPLSRSRRGGSRNGCTHPKCVGSCRSRVHRRKWRACVCGSPATRDQSL